MQELHDLDLLLRSHTPILVIESREEPRIVQLFTRLALRRGRPGYRWTFFFSNAASPTKAWV